MASTSNNAPLSERDIFYFRYRFRNRVFQSVMAYFASQAKGHQLTRANIAAALGKDPAQITRWFSGPGNWTLDTVSDLLLAMNAEMSDDILPFHESSVTSATTPPQITISNTADTEQSARTTEPPKSKWKAA
jgi:hypothetical protein